MGLTPFDGGSNLAERDMRLLARKVCERVFALGGSISRFGVSLDTDGMWFTGVVNGKAVTARTGQGNFTYDQIARDLILASFDPGWNKLTVLPQEKHGPKSIVEAARARS
jgi:hypothetical protein